MGEGPFSRLRFLRGRRRPPPNPYRWINDAPRVPPIPLTSRISDASSIDNLSEIINTPTTPLSPHFQTINRRSTSICVICLENVPSGESHVALPCDHASWHPECVITWLHRVRRCPLCNTTLESCNQYQHHHSHSQPIHEQPFPSVHSSVEIRNTDLDSEEDLTLRQPRRFSSQDLAWLLCERRHSLVSRPVRTRRSGRLGIQRFTRTVSARR